MFFASDNTSGAHPAIVDAVLRANDGYASSYGADDPMAAVTARIRDMFEAPDAVTYLVATGTAANSLALASLAQPWSTIFCTKMAHINEDECNAPEFYTGGAKLTLVASDEARMSPDALRAAILAEENRGVHGPQRGPIAITQATERGTIYSLDDIAAIGGIAREFALPLHMDGARFANAIAALGCSPAEMTWKRGVTALSLGGTKNGCLGVEAVVFFDPAPTREFEFRRKRGAHLFSKHRFLSAQMAAYLDGDLWLDLATRANATCARLVRGMKQLPHVRFAHDPQANIVFAEWPRALHRKLSKVGAQYHIMSGDDDGPEDEMQLARLVTSWSTTDEDIDRFIDLMR